MYVSREGPESWFVEELEKLRLKMGGIGSNTTYFYYSLSPDPPVASSLRALFLLSPSSPLLSPVVMCAVAVHKTKRKYDSDWQGWKIEFFSKKKNYLHDYLLRLLYYLLLRCVLWLYIKQKKKYDSDW